MGANASGTSSTGELAAVGIGSGAISPGILKPWEAIMEDIEGNMLPKEGACCGGGGGGSSGAQGIPPPGPKPGNGVRLLGIGPHNIPGWKGVAPGGGKAAVGGRAGERPCQAAAAAAAAEVCGSPVGLRPPSEGTALGRDMGTPGGPDNTVPGGIPKCDALGGTCECCCCCCC